MSGDGIAVNLLALYANSVTRLGDILNVWVTNFLSKLAQIFADFWAILKGLGDKFSCKSSPNIC